MEEAEREAALAARHDRQQRATEAARRATEAARRAELRDQAEKLQRETSEEAQAAIAQLAAERDGAHARVQQLEASLTLTLTLTLTPNPNQASCPSRSWRLRRCSRTGCYS